MSRERKPAVAAVEDEEYAAACEMAALKFEAVEVDWTAFAAENWAKRSRDEGVLNRMLQVVMSKDDQELTAMLAEGGGGDLDAMSRMAETFRVHAEKLRSGAESFQAGSIRLLVASYRVLYRLDRDGNPLPPDA